MRVIIQGSYNKKRPLSNSSVSASVSYEALTACIFICRNIVHLIIIIREMISTTSFTIADLLVCFEIIRETIGSMEIVSAWKNYAIETNTITAQRILDFYELINN